MHQRRPRRGAAAGRAFVLAASIAGSALLPRPLWAQPPPDVCSGLSGAAAAFCRQYCIRLECNVSSSPLCERFREQLARRTGSPIFPCDVPTCGNGRVEPPEECDPPGSLCEALPVGRCGPTCLCASCPPRCGDGVCAFDEDNCTCPSDCRGSNICFDCVVLIQPPVCGDGACDGRCVLDGETSERCPQDCLLICPL